MGDSFFAYLAQVESMAFFSGYPLFYALIRVIAANFVKRNELQNRLVLHLPHSYALVATIYLFLQLKNLFPDYSFARMHMPYLKAWAIAAVLFWIPALSKRPVWSLLHSLVFFYFIVRDLILQILHTPGDTETVTNDMKLFSVSVLFNLVAFLAILLASTLIHRLSKKDYRI